MSDAGLLPKVDRVVIQEYKTNHLVRLPYWEVSLFAGDTNRALLFTERHEMNRSVQVSWGIALNQANKIAAALRLSLVHRIIDGGEIIYEQFIVSRST